MTNAENEAVKSFLQAQMNQNVPSRASGVTVYAINYNVLRIVAGLGGVLFTV
jgi:hypothetical protein